MFNLYPLQLADAPKIKAAKVEKIHVFLFISIMVISISRLRFSKKDKHILNLMYS